MCHLSFSRALPIHACSNCLGWFAWLAPLQDYAIVRRLAYWQKCVRPEVWKDCAAVAMVWKSRVLLQYDSDHPGSA